MSTLREVLDKLTEGVVTVEVAEDGRLRLCACLEEHPITPEVRELCEEHKPLLLRYALWVAAADKLLIDSTRRGGAAWPQGCTALDDDTAWDELEHRLTEAYWSMDRDRLQKILEAREIYSLQVFARYREEVRHD